MGNDRARKKSVTWSPVVVPVNKPSRIKTQTSQVEKSQIRMSHDATGLSRDVSGYLTAKSRGDTRSLLLTMRNNSHRDMQFLIDLPAQTIRRIYDGRHSWDVHRDGTPFLVSCHLGQIHWTDDEIREPSARGFRLDWLNGDLQISARRSQPTTSRKARDSTRRVRYRASRSALHSSASQTRRKAKPSSRARSSRARTSRARTSRARSSRARSSRAR